LRAGAVHFNKTVRVLNDFEATALSLPQLTPPDVCALS
jgi:glucokinase